MPATSNGPFVATILFNESVTGFSQSDITVNNARLTNFSGSGFRYSVQVIPTATGEVSLLVPANSARDSGGNGNTISPTARSTYTVPPTTVSVSGSATASEGDNVTFTVTRIGDLTAALTVGVTVSETGAMVASTNKGSRNVTIQAGQNSVSVSVPTVEDDTTEDNSTVTLAVNADSTTPPAYTLGSPSRFAVLVFDDELPGVSITAVDTSITEGEEAEFVLTRTGDVSDSLVARVRLNPALTQGIQTADGGFETRLVSVPQAGTTPEVTIDVSFAPGSSRETLVLPTLDDGVDFGAGWNLSAFLLSDQKSPATYSRSGPVIRTVYVTDNDRRGISFSPSPLTVDEGASTSYTVVLDSRPSISEDVVLTSSSSNPEVTVVQSTLIFTRENWKVPQTVTLRVARDADRDDDTATITYASEGSDYGLNNVRGSLSVTVTDVPPPTVSITPVRASITEDEVAEFNISRTGGTADELTVTYTISETALMVASADKGGASLTFFAGEESKTIRVPTQGDRRDEPDSVVTLTVAGGSDYEVGTATAEVVVSDDDTTPTVTLIFDNPTPFLPSISEGETVDLRARLSNPSVAETRVTVSLPAEEAGEFSLEGDPVLVIPQGQTESSNTVTVVSLDDDRREPLRFFPITGAAENDFGVFNPPDVQLLITDNDLAEVSLTADTETVTESGAAAFTLTRTRNTDQPLSVTVEISTSVGASTTTVITFPIGSNTMPLRVRINDDTIVDNDRTITATIVDTPSSYVLGSPSEAEIMVIDNDEVTTKTFAPSSVNRRSGGGGGGSSDRSRAREAIQEVENLLEETPHAQAQEKLEEAWRAYDQRDYREARSLVREALRLLADEDGQEDSTGTPQAELAETTAILHIMKALTQGIAENHRQALVSCTFTRTLSLSSSPGADIHCLQTYLNTSTTPVAVTGPGSPGAETLRYGSLTKEAVTRWQEAQGLVPTGVFDQASIARYGQLSLQRSILKAIITQTEQALLTFLTELESQAEVEREELRQAFRALIAFLREEWAGVRQELALERDV